MAKGDEPKRWGTRAEGARLQGGAAQRGQESSCTAESPRQGEREAW